MQPTEKKIAFWSKNVYANPAKDAQFIKKLGEVN